MKWFPILVLSSLIATGSGVEANQDLYRLTDCIDHSLEYEKLDPRAKSCAESILAQDDRFFENWDYGNAIHKAHILLGLLDFESGNIDGAETHLLQAGLTPGSPQLDSFGPNMILAKKLLEKNRREAVVEFFELCRKFWDLGQIQLDQWKTTVRDGNIPDFGANLKY